jgi:DNA invertase Pin-like site-specific DNA recombinase
MRLIAYIRVSRVAGREGESFISTKVQRERIEAMAAAQRHVIVDWQEDLDQPGSKWNRPGLQAALEAVEAGAAEGVIVAKLDRFARSLTDAVAAIQRLAAVDGQLISVEDGFDSSTSMGRFARDMVLRLGELELDRIRENWRAAGSHAANRGVHVCKVAPVGYRKAEDGRLEPDPLTAPIIRDVFRRRGAGASWNELCAFLDERLPLEDGRKWSRSTLTTMIKRRTYLGEARGGGVVNPDAHPPIVTRVEFEAANVVKVDGRHSRGADGGALLTGLVRCATCGNTLTRVSNGSRGYHNYKCRKRNGNGLCAAPAGISLRRADAHVEQAFLDALEVEPLAARGEPAEPDLGQALTALEAAEDELVAYRDENLISVIGRDAYVAGLGKRQEAVEEARRLVGESSSPSPFAGVRDLAKLWPSLDVKDRRHLLGSVLERIEVTPAPGAGRGADVADRLTLVWK